MADPDEADLAVERLEAALSRIAARQDLAATASGRDTAKLVRQRLDHLILRLRSALEE